MESPFALRFEDLPALFPGFAEPRRWLAALRRHAELVQAAAPRVRVTSVPPEEFPRRHYAESLELLAAIRAVASGGPIVDVGSGGGFPGLVFAVLEPDTRIHLIEPLRKRARLLQDLAAELELANVTVHPLRAEDAARGPLRDSAAVVTARAVAELRVLLEYTAPFAATGGFLAFPKGSGARDELVAAATAMRTLRCEHLTTEPMRPPVSETLQIVLARKVGATLRAYPRRAGLPERSPL